MRKHLFVSVRTVVRLAALSVIALANSNMETSAAEHIQAVVSSCVVETEAAESNFTWSRDWEADESYMLAKIAMAEAEGEDMEGKALVMLVVLNRVLSDGFPDSIEEVIFQDGQFDPVASGRYDSVEPDEDCWAALELVQAEHWDESQGALYFERKSASTWHRDNLQFLFQHGKHLFYTDKGE